MNDLALNGLEFVRLPSGQLQGASRKYFLQIRRLADKHRPKQALGDQQFLAKIMTLVVSQPDVAQWDTNLKETFVDLVGGLFAAELGALEVEGLLSEAAVADLQTKADWLCNVALAGMGTAPTEPILRAIRLWIHLRIISRVPTSDLESVVTNISLMSDAFGIDPSILADQAKLQAILHITEGARSESIADSTLEQVKDWCQQLVTNQALREVLYASATRLSAVSAHSFQPAQKTRHCRSASESSDLACSAVTGTHRLRSRK